MIRIEHSDDDTYNGLVGSEMDMMVYDRSLLDSLKSMLADTPKPYFVTTLFSETHPLAVCRPLPAPFDHYAITHFGQVFIYRPLKLWYYDPAFPMLDPCNYVFPNVRKPRSGVQAHERRPIVRLQNKGGTIRKSFLVDRLMMERFYGIPLTDRVEMVYHDGNSTNTHLANLEAFLLGSGRVVPEDAFVEELNNVRPLH